MTITVRVLAANDIEHFEQLRQLFAVAFEEPYEPLTIAYVQRLLANPNFAAIIALDDNQVVGGLTLYLWDAYIRQERQAYLYDLAVAETHRRCGIATDLMAGAVTFAAAHNIAAMWVQAEAEDEHAVAFYRSLDVEEIEVRHFELL